jgi:hypothetical protein
MQKEGSGDDKESGAEDDSPVKKKRKNRRKNKRRKKKEAQEGAVQGDALLGGTEANRLMEDGSSMYHGVNGDCAQEDGGTVIGNTSEADFEKYL